MPRPCSVCSHQDRFAIDKALVDGVSYRDIAQRFGLDHTAVGRHKKSHLAELLAENITPTAIATEPQRQSETQRYAVQRAERDQAEAIDILAKIARAIERLELMGDAVHEWLQDPDNPGHYTLDPRAEDVTVVYREPLGEVTPGVMAYSNKRKDKLSVLLRQLVESKQLSIEAVEMRHADPRELLGKTYTAIQSQLTLLTSIYEKLHSAQEVEAFYATVLDTIAEVAPDVRSRIIDKLQQRRPLRRFTGSPPGREAPPA